MQICCGLAFSAGLHCLQSAMRYVSSLLMFLSEILKVYYTCILMYYMYYFDHDTTYCMLF